MNTIATVTLNPALDFEIHFDVPFQMGELNRVSYSHMSAGGKGINVSKILNLLGKETVSFGFVGGDTGKVFLDLLEKSKIPIDFTQTECQTRINTKMIDSKNVCTEANEKGGPVQQSEWSILLEKLKNSTKNIQLFILGGSIPNGVEKTVYRDIVLELKKNGAKIILDCDGEALRHGIEAAPYLIKPNLFELTQYAGKEFKNIREAIDFSKKLFVEKGINVLCTLGKDGAFYVGELGICTVNSPQVQIKSFTGAGDTFLAAFVSKLCDLIPSFPKICIHEKEEILCRAMQFASSAATYKVTLDGTTPKNADGFEAYCDRIKPIFLAESKTLD